MSDALATLGTIIDDTAKRDAIHIAVIPAIAGENLYPGEHIFVGKSSGHAYGASDVDPNMPRHGIVDPYLTVPIAKGERFWLFLYPRTITSLRHVWSHPDFPEEAA